VSQTRRTPFLASAMVEDILEVATCFLEGVGEDGQALKGMFIVNGLGEGSHGVREPADLHQPTESTDFG
jgi:hypothetical protein